MPIYAAAVGVGVEDEVDRSAAPAAVWAALANLEAARPGSADRLAAAPTLRAAAVAVIAASRSLSRLVIGDAAALDVLGDLDRRRPTPSDGAGVDDLVRWKQLELLRIAARDLVGRDPLEATGRLLADMADDVLAGALRIAGPPAAGVVVVAMGKAGARELNYASDVDVFFVGHGDARGVLRAGRRCFRIDPDLRPEGRDGALVRSLDGFERYWREWAQTWEFQALLKARPAAGDPMLAAAFAAAAAAQVWGRPFGADDLRSVRHMKARSEQEVARRGLSDRELKRGRGGIRDIEFAIQLLQLVHGRNDPALRTPATFDALAELAAGGYVGEDDATALADAYRFLRMVEHRLQLVDEQQVHALPASPDARAALARVMGYRDGATATAVGAFDAELVRHQSTARGIHERLFFRPLLEAFTSPGRAPLSDAVAHERLTALGFADVVRTRAAVVELTRGLSRSSRLMGSLLPLLLEWLSESPDPDLGLLGLRTLATGHHRSATLLGTIRESNEAARRLCTILGTSRMLAATIERQPGLLSLLGDDAALRPRSRHELAVAAMGAVGVRQAEDRSAALRRLKHAEELRIATAWTFGVITADAVGPALSALADAVLEAALTEAAPEVPMAVIAMGRLGGSELAFASDLDVVLAHGGRGPADQALAEAAAARFLRLLNGPTPAHRVWTLDLDLRPEGKQGRLATSMQAWQGYAWHWAQTWERQALVRARPVAGDDVVQCEVAALIADFVWGRPFVEDEAREVRRMKARIERERIPHGEDPQFHLKLGRGSLSDVEWTAQLLQLRHGVPEQSTPLALLALVGAGALGEADAATLTEAWRFCESTRNRLFLVRGAGSDALPAVPGQLAVLARASGTTSAELRDHYRRVTRKARAVVDRVFYGSPPR